MCSSDPIKCECGWKIWDGEAIRSRCVKPAQGIALCRCKRWVAVPVRLPALVDEPAAYALPDKVASASGR